MDIKFNPRTGDVDYISKGTNLHISRFHYGFFHSFDLSELIPQCKKHGGKILNEVGEEIFDSGFPLQGKSLIKNFLP